MQGFYGWRVVAAAFVLAVFGWGLGFYGPPVFLHALREERGWSLALVSTAITIHFLSGATVIALLPAFYERCGLSAVTRAGAAALALGIWAWAVASQPWQLFAATLLSGAGWAAMGPAAVNEIVSPWFVRRRPAALSMAYNGASIGGVVFSPVWAAAIGRFGFAYAAAVIGIVAAVTTWSLAGLVFSRTPAQMGVLPDGDGPLTHAASPDVAPAPQLPGAALWRDPRFVTLSGGMALGLFAQIGLIAHLFSLLVPALGDELAGLTMGAATAAAVAGRLFVGWLMPVGADRRQVACLNYGAQIAGGVALLVAGGHAVPLLVFGALLFGAGIGNATSLPPLIAQAEFSAGDVRRVVALIVAISQASYAFAPMAFGVIRQAASSSTVPGAAPLVFIAAALIQMLAIGSLIAGRGRTAGRRAVNRG